MVEQKAASMVRMMVALWVVQKESLRVEHWALTTVD